MTKKDLKEGLSSARKADITHIRTPFMVYGARACEYGDAKYERANYARPMDNIQEDFKRLRAYLRAAISHIMYVLDQMEYHQATDYHLQDIEGMLKACYAVDTDAKAGQVVGASGLPHLCGAVASLNLAITQAVRAGLLPEDPGTPWTTTPIELDEDILKDIMHRFEDDTVVNEIQRVDEWKRNSAGVPIVTLPPTTYYVTRDCYGHTEVWSGIPELAEGEWESPKYPSKSFYVSTSEKTIKAKKVCVELYGPLNELPTDRYFKVEVTND